jgi:hypothetical protein
MIIQRHRDEFLASAIHPHIIDLNFESLKGQDALEAVLYGEMEALGKKSPHSLQYTTTPLKRLFERFKHLEDGGWSFRGIDPLNCSQYMKWGCFKADRPRYSFSDLLKMIKYEHPGKVPTRAFFVVPSWEIGVKIAIKAGEQYIESYKSRCPQGDFDWSEGDRYFWEWAIEINLPITITEGAKKAACLISAGYACIGLPGITGGVRTSREDGNGFKEKCAPYLIPELEIFVTTGRRVNIVFDHETKIKTIRNVQREINKLGELFQKDKRDVRVISFPGPEKGVDDFIVAHGEEEFDLLYNKAPDYRIYQFNRGWQLTKTPTLTLNVRYLGDLPTPTTGPVFIYSGMGTGKTKRLEPIAQDAIASGRRVLVITHRVELGRAICNAVGVPWVEECKGSVEGKTLGYGLCVDSLHPLSQANFDPEAWEGAAVIIDEVEQVLWHLFNSTTCAEKRTAILSSLETLLKSVLTTGGLLIAQDADLSNYSIDYLTELSGIENLEPYIVVNKYKGNGRKVHFYSHKVEALYKEIDKQIREGKRMIIVEDSQKVKGKFSAINMESHIRKNHPHVRVIRIDSETVSNPNHPAFCCAKNIDTVIESGQYDVVIASPTIGTGVSIDLKGYFHSVFGLFKGAIATNDVLQMMSRLRDLAAEWHLWCAQYGCSKVGNGSSGAHVLLESQDRVTRKHIEILEKYDRAGFDIDTQTDTRHTSAWAKYAARINAGQWKYRETVLYLLKQEGHDVSNSDDSQMRFDEDRLASEEAIARQMGDLEKADDIQYERGRIEVITDELDSKIQVIKAEAEEIRTQNRVANAEVITNAEDISFSKYEKLQDKKAKTPEELAEQQKYYLKDTYKIDVTPELVLKDEDGWLKQLRLHYFYMNPEQVHDRDANHIKNAVQNGDGQVHLPDIKLYSACVEILKLMELDRFLNGEEFTNESELIQKLGKIFKEQGREIREYFKVGPTGLTPIAQINRFFKDTIGLRMSGRQIRDEEGNRTRAYSFKGFEDGRSVVFEAWDKNVAQYTNNEIMAVTPKHNRRLIQNTDTTNEIQCDQIQCDHGEEGTPFPVDLKRGEEAQRVAISLTKPEEAQNTPKDWQNQGSAVGSGTLIEAVSNSWKGVVRLVKSVFPECWVAKYEVSFLKRNLLLETAGKAFTIDSPTAQWVHNALDPDGGAWAFQGYIEGSTQMYTIPLGCLDFNP